MNETFIITAGSTREFIDPVRFITNRSSGKMGYALAQAAKDRGAKVILISGPSNISHPAGIDIIKVQTAEAMRQQVLSHLNQSTVLIMAAAVSDYRPSAPSKQKIKKKLSKWSLEMEPTVDILSEISKRSAKQLLVGFAAETENIISNAKKKLKQKKLHLIVANDITLKDSGFESDYGTVSLLDKYGEVKNLPRLPKRQIAEIILDKIEELLRDERARSKRANKPS